MSALAASLDALIERAGERSSDLHRVRPVHDVARGRVPDSDEYWEHWSNAFIEWAVCEGHLHLTDVPAAAAPWLTAHRSLFAIARIGNGETICEDLSGEGVYRVLSDRRWLGVERGDIVELRLVAADGAAIASPRILFHPGEVRQLLRNATAELSGRALADLAARAFARARSQPRALVRAYEAIIVDATA